MNEFDNHLINTDNPIRSYVVPFVHGHWLLVMCGNEMETTVEVIEVDALPKSAVFLTTTDLAVIIRRAAEQGVLDSIARDYYA